MKEPSARKILIIYTGGTIGMKRKDGGGLTPDSLENLRKNIPEVDQLPYDIEWQELKSKDENTGKEVFIDSSQARLETFNMVGQRIKENYEKYDGFVVVYGTDTMEDAAGSLSYMLDGLNKPVVFTGSMDPAIDREREKNAGEIKNYRIEKVNDKKGSDGPRNLVDAVHLAGRSGFEVPLIPEVVLCFYGRIIRGNNSHKYNAQQRDAFYEPEQQEVIGRIRHGEDESSVEEYGLSTDFKLECEIILDEKSLLSSGEPSLNFHKLEEGLKILPIGIATPLSADIVRYADVILIFDRDVERESELFKLIEDNRSDNAVVFYNRRKDAPSSEWCKPESMMRFRQALMKLYYVLSRTRDPLEIKELLKHNLRGESKGEIIRESKILEKQAKEVEPNHERTLR